MKFPPFMVSVNKTPKSPIPQEPPPAPSKPPRTVREYLGDAPGGFHPDDPIHD